MIINKILWLCLFTTLFLLSCGDKNVEQDKESSIITVDSSQTIESKETDCVATTAPEWNQLLEEAKQTIQNDSVWYASLDEHISNKNHSCYNKTKEECLEINARYVLKDMKNYCPPSDGNEGKEGCSPTTRSEWSKLLTEAKANIKADGGWYSTLDRQMEDENHGCFGKTKEECLEINAKYVLTDLKNYCPPPACTTTTKAEWEKLTKEVMAEIKGTPEWYATLDEHLQTEDHPCFEKDKETCLRINAEYVLQEQRNYCPPATQ